MNVDVPRESAVRRYPKVTKRRPRDPAGQRDDAHRRQRELVVASLLRCPSRPPATSGR